MQSMGSFNTYFCHKFLQFSFILGHSTPMMGSGSHSEHCRMSNMDDCASSSLKVLQLHCNLEEFRVLLLLTENFGSSDLKSKFIISSSFYLILFLVDRCMQTSKMAES